MIKWINIKKKKDFFTLTVEGDITIKKLFERFGDLFSERGALLIAVDANEREFLPIIGPMLTDAQIDFEIVGRWVWIDRADVSKLFEKTEFGESLEACYFLKYQPKKNKDQRELGAYLEDDGDVLVSYEQMPDLLVVSKSIEVLNKLKENLTSKEYGDQ